MPPPAGPHPPNTIVKGSTTVLIGGQPAARIGDSTGCGATIVGGFAHCPDRLRWPRSRLARSRMPKAFLGPRLGVSGAIADGAIATAEYEEDIRQAIRIILDTDPASA